MQPEFQYLGYHPFTGLNTCHASYREQIYTIPGPLKIELTLNLIRSRYGVGQDLKWKTEKVAISIFCIMNPELSGKQHDMHLALRCCNSGAER